MPGDTSSTDFVSSGFSGFPGSFGGQASLKPAEVALMVNANPLVPTLSIRDSITHESLRAEIKSTNDKVTTLSAQVQASEARRMQAEIDQLRASQTSSVLAQILAAVTKTTPSA